MILFFHTLDIRWIFYVSNGIYKIAPEIFVVW